MPGRRIKTISKSTKTLLAEGESERVDFKRTPDSISTEDLVSFANAAAGGSIVAGIEERSTPDGAQIGVVRGCGVTDGIILQITNKALSCIPPLAIEVYVENLSETPFLRIDIPSSQTKPHCTPKGIYCRRDGSRNRPLQPTELLKIFLDSESRAFAEKFEAAADRIATDLNNLEASLDSRIQSMADQLGWADSKLGDTESTLDSILAYTVWLNDEAKDISGRLRALFRQDDREDPVRTRVRKEVMNNVIKQLSEDRDLFKKVAAGGSVSMSLQGKAALDLTKDELKNILTEAIETVAESSPIQKTV